jgi:hypothetical protein
MSDAGQCPTCGGDCGTGDCESLSAADAGAQADGFDDWDDEPCSHICEDDGCEDEWGYSACTHSHCMNCGGCGCPGYCDDHQTYNLRPAETGGVRAEGA